MQLRIQTKYELGTKHVNQLMQNNQNRVDEYTCEIERNTANIQILNVETDGYNREMELLNQKIIDKLKIEKKIRELTKLEEVENNLNKHKKTFDFFHENDTCPTCKQEIQESFKNEQVKSLDKKIKETDDGLKQLENKILEQQTILNEMGESQKKIQNLQIKIATNTTAIVETNKYIQKINNEIIKLQGSDNSIDEEKESWEIEKGITKIGR